MSRRTVLLQTAVVGAMLVVACVAVLLVLSQKKAEATFPGQNGRIAFAARDTSEDVIPYPPYQIFTVEPDGTAEKQLTHSKSVGNGAPSFSPAGKKIVWVRNSRIWLMNADGTNKERLTGGPQANDHAPTFSPDGTKIAWVRNSDIWVMNADGTDEEALTSGTEAIFSGPSFSPDGTKVAFTRYNPQTSSYAIYTTKLDGSGTRLVNTDPNYKVGVAVFSPRTNRIAFDFYDANPECTYCTARSGIATVRPNGTHFRPLAIDDPDSGSSTLSGRPQWAPDGRSLVFMVHDFDHEREHLDIVRADGTGQHTVFDLPSPYFSANSASFSPDGKKLVFNHHYENDGDEIYYTDIWTVNTDGSGLSDLRDAPPNPAGEGAPDWQPKLQPTG